MPEGEHSERSQQVNRSEAPSAPVAPLEPPRERAQSGPTPQPGPELRGDIKPVTSNDVPVAFGAKLREYRERLHISKRKMARSSGVSRRFLARIESGLQVGTLNASTVFDLVSALSLDHDAAAELVALAGHDPFILNAGGAPVYSPPRALYSPPRPPEKDDPP